MVVHHGAQCTFKILVALICGRSNRGRNVQLWTRKMGYLVVLDHHFFGTETSVF